MPDTTVTRCGSCGAVGAEQCAESCPERVAVRLLREPWGAGRIRSELLRAPDDARVRVRTEDGSAEFDVVNVVRWYEPIGKRWLVTLTVQERDPAAEYVRLTLAEDAR